MFKTKLTTYISHILKQQKQGSSAILAGTPEWYVNLLRDEDRHASTSRLMEQNIANLKSENSTLKDCLLHGLASTKYLFKIERKLLS